MGDFEGLGGWFFEGVPREVGFDLFESGCESFLFFLIFLRGAYESEK